MRHSNKYSRRFQQGTSMLEVLITIIILAFGLLGLAGLQAQAIRAEAEAYQRGQAILLLQDMVDRMSSNLTNAGNYVTANPLGTGDGRAEDEDCAALSTRALSDQCEWSKALKGAAEQGSNGSQGAMIEGRGCVEATSTAREYRVSVVWLGINATAASSLACAQDEYDEPAKRRVISTIVRVPDLSAD